MFDLRHLVPAVAGVALLASSASAVILSNPVADGTIAIDGSFDDWNGIERYPDDGQEAYPIDIGFVTMAHDSTNLYVRYQMYFPSPAFSGGWKLLIDTDLSAGTGYHGQNDGFQGVIGAERMVEGASVFEFTGGDAQGAFSWNWLGFFGFSEAGAGANDIEVVVPLSSLGNNVETFNFVLWIDSNSDGGLNPETLDDIFPNGAFEGSPGTVHAYTLVPEPASIALLTTFGAALLRRRRPV